MEYINALIEQREVEERALKKQEMEALKSVWAQQQTNPKNQPSNKTDPWVPEECGLSALQSFAGEDTSSAGRMRLQQQQVLPLPLSSPLPPGAALTSPHAGHACARR